MILINGKNIKPESEILEIFNIQKSTISQWYRRGLQHFTVNRNNYVFEEDLEQYFRANKK